MGVERERATEPIRVAKVDNGESAHSSVETLNERSKTDAGLYIARLRACHMSGNMRRIIDTEMKESGVNPDLSSFNILVGQLVIEGDMDAAKQVVSVEMRAARVKPNNKTFAMLNKSEHSLKKMRIKKMNYFVKSGYVSTAQEFMNTLKRRGLAEDEHYNILLGACQNSAEMRRIISSEMPDSGVEADVISYTVLVHQLMLEGNTAAAKHVVEDEMPACRRGNPMMNSLNPEDR